MNIILLLSFIHAFGGLFNQLTRDKRPASARPASPAENRDLIVRFCWLFVGGVGGIALFCLGLAALHFICAWMFGWKD